MDFKSIIRQLIIEQDESKLTNWYNSLVKPKEGKSKEKIVTVPQASAPVQAPKATKKQPIDLMEHLRRSVYGF
jgi:hypothetical protein